MFKRSCLSLVLICFQIYSFIDLSSVSLLCLVHEGVEGVVEGVHEVGVMDRGLGACKLKSVYWRTNKETKPDKQPNNVMGWDQVPANRKELSNMHL